MSPQAKQILKDARERYGKAWDLMSDDQRQNYLHSRVLMVVLAQHMPQYEAAQSFATQIIGELEQ